VTRRPVVSGNEASPPHRRLSVPDHRELAKGTLRSLIQQAGLTLEDFSQLL